jgi:hypothetical protein
MTNTQSTIIAALNVTVDPELDKIITGMADIECGFGSYEKAVRYAASRSTYEEVTKLRAAYEKLAETMQHVATVKQILFQDGNNEL